MIAWLYSQLRELAKRLFRAPYWQRIKRAHLQEHPWCAACGYGGSLQVHHIVPVSIDPALECVANNLIVLCMGPDQCHLHVGHGGSWQYWNPTVRDDAADLLRRPDHRDVIVTSVSCRRRLRRTRGL